MSGGMDRGAFLKPIAHRGLHDAARGIVENSAGAFKAALAAGRGIECDLRPAAGGLPIVFHDETLDRLIDGKGPVAPLTKHDLARLRYKAGGETIITFAELLDLVAGAEPLLVEIKSEWEPPDRDFLRAIAKLAQQYKGPLALMSFDPAVMAAIRELAPGIPRGIVSGIYTHDDPEDDWWAAKLGRERAFALSHLLESPDVAPDFIAYHVKALPTPVTRYVREVQRLPLLTWTVRDAADAAIAAQWADAPIYEGIRL
jgi:glycerophosphoryl diester phosphodiesterase